jgi:hypothetical protein
MSRDAAWLIGSCVVAVAAVFAFAFAWLGLMALGQAVLR